MPTVFDAPPVDDFQYPERETAAERFVNQFTASAPLTEPQLPVDLPELESTLIGITEAILKTPQSLDRAIAEPARSAELVPRLLGLSLLGFILFGIAMSLVFSSADAWPKLQPLRMVLKTDLSNVMQFETLPANSSRLEPWLSGRALKLTAAYAIGLVAATGICLPSLYFYGLLAGVRMTMLDVVTHALKAKATTAIALIGILPVYAAFALAVVLFDAPTVTRNFVFHLGLALPFLAGLAGCHSLYRGFGGLVCQLPMNRNRQRECFLRRLVLSWSVVFTAVSPVMIHELWVTFG